MKSMVTVIQEQFKSFYLICRLSFFEIKIENNKNYLGMFWEILSPMILIAIYWFVFGTGLRSGETIRGDVPFLPWMLAGIVVWFFANPAILHGTKSIYNRIKMISKMNFPMSVIPTYVIMSKFYTHLLLVAVIFIILQFFGFFPSLYLVQLPYFMFAAFVLLFGICLVTSTISVIIPDIQKFIQATLRMLLYLSPILWDPAKFVNSDYSYVPFIMKLNPLYYVVEGYRHSLLGDQWYLVQHWQYTIYFWVFVIAVMLFGASMHVKFRNRFIEYI
ncbi:MAG TPA: ABC transporter permease [Bacillales bacterium]|nr:ABC transporter permease [Bacillales bacterium]